MSPPLSLLVRAVLDEWDLQLDEHAAPPGPGRLAVAVLTADGTPATLTIMDRDDRSRHEHLVLRRWDGRGAVRLLRAEPGRGVLLLERLDAEELSDVWDLEACETVAALYADLHVPPMPQLPEQAEGIADAVEALVRAGHDVPLPRRLVEQAVSLARDLCATPPTAVLHGDLHYATVRRGRRDGAPVWLAVQPRPVNGDPHSELEPMLSHRFEEYAAPWAAGSVRDGVRGRFHALVDAGGLAEDRARDWVVVQAVLRAHRAHEAHRTARSEPGTATDAGREVVTRCISVAKAVQD